MKLREVFFLILIIAVGVVFTHIYTGKWDFDWEEGFFFDTEEFTYTDTETLDPPFPTEIQVVNRSGRIEVQGTPENRLQIRLDRRIRRRREETAKEIADQILLILEQKDQVLTVSTNRDEIDRRNFHTDFTLIVPEGTDIQVKNRYGAVQVQKVGEADIVNRNGEVRAWDIAGNLTIENSYEDVSVENVLLDCHVGSRQSTVKLTGVKGSTLVTHRFGRLELDGLEKDVIVEGPHVQIYGKSLAGPSISTVPMNGSRSKMWGPCTSGGTTLPSPSWGLETVLRSRTATPASSWRTFGGTWKWRAVIWASGPRDW